MKRREALFCWARRRCHEPAHISHQWTCERERFASQGNEATRRTRSVAMIHRMTETEPQGFRQHNLSSTRTNVRFLQFAGAARTVLYARRQGTGGAAPRGKHHHTFLESRYRSSDVGRAHLQTGEAHLFISAPSEEDIAHYTLLRKVVRQARHLCAQSAALMCLMGTPIPRYTHEGQCV